MLLVPGGRGAVSTASFWEVLICANTLKRSLFNGQENAQIDRCVLELWQFLCCWYLEEGETTITTLVPHQHQHHLHPRKRAAYGLFLRVVTPFQHHHHHP